MEIWKRNLLGLWVAEFLAMSGMSMVVPFIPFYIRELGIKDIHNIAQWSGLVIAGPFFISTFMTPVWGTLSDRFGRKIMVIRAMFGLFIITLLMSFVRNTVELFILRLFQGSVSGFIAAGLALMATSAPEEKMGYALGTLQSSVIAGTITGPFFGGIIADLIGYRKIFLVTSFLNLFAGLLVIMLVSEDKNKLKKLKEYTLLDNYKYVLKTNSLKPILLTIFLCAVGIRSIEPIFALFVETMKVPEKFLSSITGFLLAVTGIINAICAPQWGRLSDRKGIKIVLTLSILGTSFFYSLQGLVQNAIQLFIARIGLGIFLGGIIPILHTLMAQSIPPERRGGIMGIASSSLLMGNMFGPLLGGFLASTFSVQDIFFLTSTFLLGAFAVMRIYVVEPERKEKILETGIIGEEK